MSRPTPVRPAFAPLQSSGTSHASSSSSISSLVSQSSSTSSSIPVPLSSPSTSPQAPRFFGSLCNPVQPSQLQQQQQQQPFGHQQQQQQQQQHFGQQPFNRVTAPQRHPSFEYHPNRAGAGQTAAETTNYLNQAALLAEAAKRAQMAVVMRDIEGMEL